jgi:hypothetical protein
MVPMFPLPWGMDRRGRGQDRRRAELHHLHPYARWCGREISARETERFKEPDKRSRNPESGASVTELFLHWKRWEGRLLSTIADTRILEESEPMKALFLIALATAQNAGEQPRTFLAFIDGLAIGPQESLVDFELETWGVDFQAICHIPSGWRVEAGGNATPEGMLRARGTHGVTWLGQGHLRELQNFVLVTVHGPIRHADPEVQGGVVPATFKGRANIHGDQARTVEITHENVRLIPANGCPRPAP